VKQIEYQQYFAFGSYLSKYPPIPHLLEHLLCDVGNNKRCI